MSRVFLVEVPNSGEQLAAKVLVEAGTAIPRFNREYEALARLNHPGVVRVYHYGLHRGRPWFTMELLEGHSLQSWVKAHGKPGTPKRTIEVMRLGFHVAEALDYIHGRGLVHRDLKSANVLVQFDGRIKLLDFGTAQLRDAYENVTQEGEFLGTFAYASPEQFEGRDVDRRADLYSLGVLLYRLATGRRPFTAKEPAKLAIQHTKEAPKPPIKWVPELPEALNDLILEMMEKKRHDRPSNARDVARRLEAIAGRPMGIPPMTVRRQSERSLGRDKELQTLGTVLDGKPGRAVLVVGGPGSDRLRFANAVAERAVERGWPMSKTVIRRGRDLDALAELVIDLGHGLPDESSHEAKASAQALERIRERSDFETTRRRELLRMSAETIVLERARQSEHPVMLVVHHLHRCGPKGLELLVRLRRMAQQEQLGVQFLFSLDPSGNDLSSPARQRFPDGLRLQLKPLSVTQVAMAVGAMLHRRPPSQGLALAIQKASGGEPAWVEEVVRRMVDDGSIYQLGTDGNRLAWEADGKAIQVADGARRALRRYWDTLPHVHRRVLSCLAVAGDGVSVLAVAKGLGWPEKSARVVLETPMVQRWVQLDDRDAAHWRGPLVREVVVDCSGAPRVHVLRRQLAEALTSAGTSLELIDVLMAAGRYTEGVRAGMRHAQRLQDDVQYLDALVVLNRVVDGLPGDDHGVPDEILADLYLAHASCLMAVRPIDPALGRSLAQAQALAGDAFTHGRVQLARARLQRLLGHYPNARKYLLEAWEQASKAEHGRLQSVIASHLGQAYLDLGQIKTAESWLDRALDSAGGDNEIAAAHASVAVARTLYARGRITESEEVTAEAMSVFQKQGYPRGVWHALITWVHSLRLQGRYSEALALLYRRLPEARDCQVSIHYVQLLLVTAWCEVDLCRLGRAQECVDELEATIRRGEQLDVRLEAQLVKGRIQLESGQYRSALVALQEVHQRSRAAELSVLAERARALTAETMWQLRSRDEAESMFDSAVLGLMAAGDVCALAWGCVSRARAMAGYVDPATIFAPVSEFLATQPAEIIRVEARLAEARWHRRHKQPNEARAACREAAGALNTLAAKLNDTDRAALRVHPWSRQIRKGLR